MQENKELLQKALGYCFLLLKFRLRSEKEIYQRLKQKKFQGQIINQALAFLKDKGFIDDSLFASTWIASRLKRPLGLRRIKEELKLKGIDKEIIDSQISQVKKDYCELDLVTQIAGVRMNKLKNVEPAAAKRRVYAYLLRRGFSPDVVIDAVNKLTQMNTDYSAPAKTRMRDPV